MPRGPMRLDDEIYALQYFFSKSKSRLEQMIVDMEAKGNVTDYRKAILAQVNKELDILNEYADAWFGQYVPIAAKTGLQMAFDEFRKAKISAKDITINTDVIFTLEQSAELKLRTASAIVGRKARDEIRKTTIEITALKAATGSTVKESKRMLRDRLLNEGILNVPDKNGRDIPLEVYSTMVARTTIREATNRAAIDAVIDVDGDLVRCSQHFTTCPVCAVYEDRVYSISGESAEYPPLNQVPGFKDGFSTIHPNCGHVFVPYFPDYDDDAEETKKRSNRPFELDKDGEKKVDRYFKAQNKNADRNEDRKAYEKLMAKLPPDKKVTFSAFRAMKKANSKKYQELLGIVNPPKAAKTAKTAAKAATAHPIVHGTNRVNFDGLDEDRFDFYIQQIIFEQGYDGKPRVVSKAEFGRILDTDKQPFLARTYSAPTQEILGEYKRQLREGDFYVDCSVGGSQYGKGMYAAGAYSENKIQDALVEVQDYIQLNRSRGNNYSRIEKMTLDPSARIIKYADIDTEYNNAVISNIDVLVGGSATYKNHAIRYMTYEEKFTAAKIAREPPSVLKQIRNKQDKEGVAMWKEDSTSFFVFRDCYAKDKGTKAAELGYDAINAEHHGRSDSYTVVLNRTKLIIQGDD